jgi:hypothetical protein
MGTTTPKLNPQIKASGAQSPRVRTAGLKRRRRALPASHAPAYTTRDGRPGRRRRRLRAAVQPRLCLCCARRTSAKTTPPRRVCRCAASSRPVALALKSLIHTFPIPNQTRLRR